MAFDSPSVGGYTFKNPPKPMDVRWNAVQQNYTLADGGLRQRILGYKLVASLWWDEGWIRQEDLTGIMSVANDTSASITFTPRPTTYPTRSFEVIWKNKFDFKFHEGRFGAYGGVIELQSPTTTANVGELP